MRKQPDTLTAAYEAWSAPWDGPYDPAGWAATRGAETTALAALMLAAPAGTFVGGGQWSPAVTVAVNTGTQVLLTADGGPRNPGWCENTYRCKAARDWVFYERFTAEGRVAHGWLCPTCRRLIQSG